MDIIRKRCPIHKNVLKNKVNCLKTNRISFLCLGTSKTLSLEEFDESKIHIFLSPFLLHFLKLLFNLMHSYGIYT